jgi:hypothetical protein
VVPVNLQSCCNALTTAGLALAKHFQAQFTTIVGGLNICWANATQHEHPVQCFCNPPVTVQCDHLLLVLQLVGIAAFP